MRLRRIGTAAVALALTAPATAHAATWTVTPGGGDCGAGDSSCGSIAAAAEAAEADDFIEITPLAGGWAASPPVELDQARITLRGIGSGEVRINGTLSFTGSGADPQTLKIERLSVFAPAGNSALRITSDVLSADKTVSIQGSILSGSGGSAGDAALYASTEVSLNEIDVIARHVTIADKDGSPPVNEDENDEMIDVTFHYSLIASAAQNADLFANPGSEDFHLKVGSPAIDGGGQAGDEIDVDVDGETRADPWDRGGDEFVNHAPAKPSVSASASQVERGQAVGFAVSGATDPDGALGDDVAKYVWDFGDGTVEERTPGAWAHTYAAAGRYEVRVRAVDRTNASGPASDPVAVVVKDPPAPSGGGITSLTQLPGFEGGYAPNRRGPDAGPPFVALTWPRAGMRVRIRRGVPLLRGRTADQSGVRRIDLALMRREGRRCRWFDGRGAFRLGSCTAPAWFKAILDDFDWRYAFPRRVRPRAGRYFAFVRATDYLGKRTPPSRAIGFRYAR